MVQELRTFTALGEDLGSAAITQPSVIKLQGNLALSSDSIGSTHEHSCT